MLMYLYVYRFSNQLCPCEPGGQICRHTHQVTGVYNESGGSPVNNDSLSTLLCYCLRVFVLSQTCFIILICNETTTGIPDTVETQSLTLIRSPCHKQDQV
jgi:hypothetical protein